MRALVLYAHPVPESFCSALHQRVISTLSARGWDIDDCDLNAEGFSPVLSAEERRNYHNLSLNTGPVAAYVERVRAAQALIVVFPVWNFGFPAILKGFFDRVFLPGVSFEIANGKLTGCLHNIEKLAAVATYGGDRVRAILAGDPPRKIFTRPLRLTMSPRARLKYLALYDMNRASETSRAKFLERVGREMETL